MKSKLQNPAVVAALAVMISVAVGVMTFWRTAAPLAEAAVLKAAKNVKVPPVELKERGWDFWTIEIENLSSELKGERDRLRQQHEQLDQRAAQLANEARELAKVRTELEALRRGISEKIIEISADDAKNIRTLAQTYTNLTPRAVVAIVREMDDSTVVKIFSVMKVDVVSAIFEEMSRTAGADGPLSKRVAILSERMRQVKSAAKAAS
jgi:flagellar motility protein MotE (MotC chaperone)